MAYTIQLVFLRQQCDLKAPCPQSPISNAHIVSWTDRLSVRLLRSKRIKPAQSIFSDSSVFLSRRSCLKFLNKILFKFILQLICVHSEKKCRIYNRSSRAIRLRYIQYSPSIIKFPVLQARYHVKATRGYNSLSTTFQDYLNLITCSRNSLA